VGLRKSSHLIAKRAGTRFAMGARVLALDLEETQESPTTDEYAQPRRPSEPLQPGERYRLGERIARGGMGEVITAHDADIGRDVAIKRLRAPNPTPLALARFLREARIQGRLDHPAIVPVHEVAHDDDGRPFFVMKKLSGTTLAAILLGAGTQFSRHQLLRAFADVCLAIEFAHTRGVIHRDIKPSNILLGDFGEVYVLDWGIARVATDRDSPVPEPILDEDGFGVCTRPGSAIGTRGYMPPEQARGEIVDERADVYALGCVLYEILTGRMLHPRGKRGIEAPDDARPSRYENVAPELDELCMRATALDRDERIRSARELGEAVQRYLDGDRDLALRNRLARTHLAHALAAADDEEGRSIAMREAGQALALDPTLGHAAELVGRLLIEPPKAVPAQVDAELAEVDRATTRRFVWNLVILHITFVLLLPVMYAFGVRDLFYAFVVLLLAIASIGVATLELRTTHRLLGLHCVMLVLTFALIARMFTPFLIAPFAVAVNVVAFAFHPGARSERMFWSFTAASIGAVLAVWLAEAVGLVTPTMSNINGTLTLHSPIIGFSTFPVIGALALMFTIAGFTSALLTRSSARFAHRARVRIHLQAWQVRQLVPDRRQ
jgi:eukaryotic-like serine/threonine-protein kinase